MSYLLIGLLAGGGSVLLSTFFGSMITKNWRRFAFSSLWAIGYGLLCALMLWGTSTGIVKPVPLFATVLLGGSLGAVTSIEDNDYGWKGSIPGFIIAGLYAIYAVIIVGWVGTSDAFHSNKKANLIGEVEVVTDLAEVMQPADPAHICLVSEDMAGIKAQNALSQFRVDDNVIAGSRYAIGEGTKQYIDGQLWWIFPVEFQSWLKWKQNKRVPGYLRVSAENPLEIAQAVQTNGLGEKISIKYLNTACFANKAKRYLRKNSYMTTIISDWTFEPDDNWNPYYTVSILDRTTGYDGWVLKGIITLNLQTGEIKEYAKDKMPNWIDRGIPEKILNFQITKWGRYNKAPWGYVIWHDDKSQQPTPGWYITYSGEKCQWFSGFTSSNEQDKALTGFTLSDGQTGKTKFFKASGVTEDIAYATAKSLWSNFNGYTPTELVPYNIYGKITYVVPITYEGQFQGVSLVCMENKDIKARGTTMEKALSAYRTSMATAKSSSLAPAGGELQTVTLTGTIDRLGTPLISEEQQLFPFTLVGVNKIFQAIYSYATPKTLFMKVGDKVEITFLTTGEKIITCENFDIPAIVLTDTNPVQARYVENQTEMKVERTRVDEYEQRQNLMESDLMKKVDPEALKVFLKSQQSQQTTK